jgi:hypothetical protein
MQLQLLAWAYCNEIVYCKAMEIKRSGGFRQAQWHAKFPTTGIRDNVDKERLLFGPGDLAVAKGACVKNVAVFGEHQAAHPLVLFEDPIEKPVEFRFIQRLRIACSERCQCQ